MAMQVVNGTAQAKSDSGIVARVIAVGGDLDGLKPIERAEYYARVCESVGLNPLTQPFAYIKLNGKLVLYAKREASEQLRMLHKVAVTIASRERTADLMIVTARATTPDGRTDESIGAVNIAGKKGEDLANAIMKAETKAKRRVTLSITGLGWLDETEVADLRAAKRVEVTVDGEIVQSAHEAETDLTEKLHASVDWAQWLADNLGALRNAANAGRGRFNEEWADIAGQVQRIAPPKETIEALNAGKNEIKAGAGWK